MLFLQNCKRGGIHQSITNAHITKHGSLLLPTPRAKKNNKKNQERIYNECFQEVAHRSSMLSGISENESLLHNEVVAQLFLLIPMHTFSYCSVSQDRFFLIGFYLQQRPNYSRLEFH